MAAPMDFHVLETADSFPLKTKQTAVQINNNRTEIICTQFQDKLFIVVTQYNKIGSLVNIKADNVVSAGETVTSMCSTDVFMGKDEPMIHVIARNLVKELTLQKPILLAVTLKDTSIGTVKTLAKILPSLL